MSDIVWKEGFPSEEGLYLVNYGGTLRVLAVYWETGDWEAGYSGFLYWDDPHDEGSEFLREEISHYAKIPADNFGMPEFVQPSYVEGDDSDEFLLGDIATETPQ